MESDHTLIESEVDFDLPTVKNNSTIQSIAEVDLPAHLWTPACRLNFLGQMRIISSSRKKSVISTTKSIYKFNHEHDDISSCVHSDSFSLQENIEVFQAKGSI